ncbi:MAG: hypothetical protein OXH22_14000 [Chloroflexi bacterium]|nr:hypothetical protein [Chloroflexota bacterium]
MQENATGMDIAFGVEHVSTLYGHPSLTGVADPDSQDMPDEAGLVYELAIEILMEMFEGTGKGVYFIHHDELTPDSEEVIWSYSRDLGSGMRNLESFGQPVVVSARSPVIDTQLDEIAPSIRPRLQERLNLFRTSRPGQDAMPDTTMAEVEDLVTWLCDESAEVSLTISADGMLTIAVDFPGDVRLYVEVERDSSAGAAVTKERRYAVDIPGETVAELTREVILAAVQSI